MKLVITGGHHSSALPVLKILKRDFPKIEIFWIGHKYSLKGDKNPTLEYREITDLGIPFYELKAGKFYKTFDPIRLMKIPFGFLQATYYLLKIRPDAILSFGGYLAVPVVLVGRLINVPSITHEQTVVVGYANKLISKFAKRVLVSWEESKKYFASEKVVFTGLPLRESIFVVNSDSFNPDNKLPTVYITAGKTGSHIINEVVKDCLSDLLEFCNIIHQCGDHSEHADFDQLTNSYNQIKDRVRGRYFVRKFVFEDEIGEAFSRSSLVISRSGAHIVGELKALHKQCILIPIPWVSHNEQYENARVLANMGLGKIIEQRDLNSKTLTEAVKKMLDVSTPSTESRKIQNSSAAKLIVDEVFKLLKQK